jgi:hypothetical protein
MFGLIADTLLKGHLLQNSPDASLKKYYLGRLGKDQAVPRHRQLGTARDEGFRIPRTDSRNREWSRRTAQKVGLPPHHLTDHDEEPIAFPRMGTSAGLPEAIP